MGTIAWSSQQGGITADDFPGLLDFEYDSLEIVTKTTDGPTQIKFYLGALVTLVATLDITYDVDGDIATVVRTKA